MFRQNEIIANQKYSDFISKRIDLKNITVVCAKLRNSSSPRQVWYVSMLCFKQRSDLQIHPALT